MRPLAPDYPVGRMQEIIDDSGLALLLVHGKPLDALNVAQSDLCAFPGRALGGISGYHTRFSRLCDLFIGVDG